MESYEIVKDIGSGNFGVARLVRDKLTRELFAVKFIERGHKVLFFNSYIFPFFCFLFFSHPLNFILFFLIFNFFGDADRRKCSEGNLEPQITQASEYRSIQRGQWSRTTFIFNFKRVNLASSVSILFKYLLGLGG